MKKPPQLSAEPCMSSRSLLMAVIASTAFGCAQPHRADPTFPDKDKHAKSSNSPFLTPKMTPADTQAEFIPFNDNSSYIASDEKAEQHIANHGPIIQTPEVLIVEKVPGSPWPKVPEDCVYTGIIREYDTSSKPHFVVLENMCIQGKHPYDGYHVTVQADKDGHYELPFYDTHLEEREGELYLVMETRERASMKLHAPASYEPGVCSFQNYLKIFGIRDIE